ncbi:MAG: hypothetical protein U0401_35035 [Anaerolineae bacterium]
MAAWFDQRGTAVDILAAAMGLLPLGGAGHANGCGDAGATYGSDVRVFCDGDFANWGYGAVGLRRQRRGHKQLRRVACPPSLECGSNF